MNPSDWSSDVCFPIWNTLFRNPRYNPLFPRHRKPVQPIQQPEQASPPSTPPSSPNPSHRSSSRASTRSYDSWHGIDRHSDNQDDNDFDDNPLLQPPQFPHGVQHLPLQQILQPPHNPHFLPANPYADYLPPPSNAPAGSQRGSVPPAALPTDGCKHFFSYLDLSFLPFLSLFVLCPWKLWIPKVFSCGTMQPLVVTL